MDEIVGEFDRYMGSPPDQPPPIPNELRPVWEMVIEDMRDRDKVGRERYGTPLQSFNGRDPLIDAYQEVLDLAVYLRQEIDERQRGIRIDTSIIGHPPSSIAVINPDGLDVRR